MTETTRQPTEPEIASPAPPGADQATRPSDLTVASETDQWLMASQTRLEGILDIADDAIISVDSRQQITLFNQGAERIFGYTAAEVLGQPIDMLLPSRFRDIHRQHVNDFATSPDAARRMGERQDIYGRRKDGSEFSAEASISRFDLAGEKIYTVILRDITARKRFEQELRGKNLELERAIQAKDRFLASMSHELRTPLNAIIGFTGTLLMRLPGPLTADQEKQLTTIQMSAKHLLSLINDLLDLAKIESGKVELSLGPVACRAVIDEVDAALRPLAERKGLRFDICVPNQNIILRTDRRALSQILINLVNNAIKFTDHGEVQLLVTQHDQQGRRAIEFRVADTGIGIRPEEQARLFDAFAQGKAHAHEGTGLGLHLSQKLAALLGGRIAFQSTYGQGSTLVLLIPEQ